MTETLKTIREIGEDIGYGRMMQYVAALWRLDMIDRYGYGTGAFVAVPMGMIRKKSKGKVIEETMRYVNLVQEELDEKEKARV